MAIERIANEKIHNDDAVFISLNHTVVDLRLCFRTGPSIADAI